MNTLAYRVARKRGLSIEDAEDFSQWIELQKLKGCEATHLSFRLKDFFRTHRKHFDHVSLHDYSNPNEPSYEMRVDEFDKLMRGLREVDQFILQARFRYEWQVCKIARHLRLSPSRVSQRIYCALAYIQGRWARTLQS